MTLWLGYALAALAALTLLVAGSLWRHRKAAQEVTVLAAQVLEERRRADAFAGDAARLPDTLSRAQRAEASAAEGAAAVQALIGREAGVLARLAEVSEERQRHEATHQTVLTRNAELQTQLDGQRQTAATAAAAANQAREEASRLAALLRESQATSEALSAELKTLSVERATATAERDAALTLGKETQAFLTEAREKLPAAFTAAAAEVFDARARALDEQIKNSGLDSKRNLEETLKPFAEHLTGMQTRLETLTASEAEHRGNLMGTIEALKQQNQDMADATNAVTSALKGNAKVRGQWGEMMLETVLKLSGLEEGKNYDLQHHGTDDDGQRRFADVVVKFPDGRAMVIDSKVSLIAWMDVTNADTPEAQVEAMGRHFAAVKAHVVDLAKKNYPKALGPHCHDTTVMFVPIEGALSAALTHNSELQLEAFKNGIVLTSSNTLMLMLQVVAKSWHRDRVQRQITSIADEAGKLVESVTLLLEDLDELGTALTKGQGVYDQVRNRLETSPQSVLNRTRRLVAAGAKGKKPIPEALQSEESAPALSLDGGQEVDNG